MNQNTLKNNALCKQSYPPRFSTSCFEITIKKQHFSLPRKVLTEQKKIYKNNFWEWEKKSNLTIILTIIISL